MQLNYLYIESYKNLENFEWEISENDSSQIVTIIGENGAGKSNLLEAIVHIFNCLNFNESIEPEFSFSIRYRIQSFLIEIKGKKGSKSDYTISIDGENIAFNEIKRISKTWHYAKNGDKLEGLLPENIIAYYSGYSRRIHSLFSKTNSEYAKIFRKGKSISLPPLLLVQPFHFKMILLALFSFDEDFKYIHNDFLKGYFGIEKFESVAIHIKKHTNWVKDRIYNNFFDTKGVVRSFLFTLDEIQKLENDELNLSEATSPPFKVAAKTNTFLVNKVIYLLKNHSSLVNLKRQIGLEPGLFKMLNILYQSGYLDNIVIMLKKEGVNEPISFDDLSEGEQQLLAIKGSIELLRGKNNLFLWDEPDTFLNPRWQWDLIPNLEEQIGDKVDDQFILTTHSPVLLTTNKKGVFEMENGKLSSVYNTFGLSINDVLTKQQIISQPENIKEHYEQYLTLIQEGNGTSDDALTIRKQLEELWGINHPDIIKADIYLKYYK